MNAKSLFKLAYQQERTCATPSKVAISAVNMPMHYPEAIRRFLRIREAARLALALRQIP